jgi:hypothetical protein
MHAGDGMESFKKESPYRSNNPCKTVMGAGDVMLQVASKLQLA